MSRRKDSRQYSASEILSALRAGPFHGNAFAFLEQVRNGTGFQRQDRYADAVVMSCWPSRGLWVAGFEVKVARSDWKHELADPAKSEGVQRFCNYWWVAAPEGIVKVEEMPETWGLYLFDGKKISVAKEAPKLSPEPLDLRFIASVLRNASEAQDRVRLAGHGAGYKLASEHCDESAVEKIRGERDEANREKRDLEQKLEWTTRDHAQLKDAVRAFERSAGLPERTVASHQPYMGKSSAGEHFRAAQLLAQRPPEMLAAEFRAVADALGALAATGKETAA